MITRNEILLALAVGGMVALVLIWSAWTFAGVPVVSVSDCLEYGRTIR